MSIHKIPLATLQKIRLHLQQSLPLQTSRPEDDRLPDSIEALGNLFESGSINLPISGWRLSSVDPADVLDKLPGLQLQPDYRFVSYLWRDGRGDRSVVWAVPQARATTALLEQAIARASAIQPPQPQSALPNFMQAIDGNRSPGSFLIASLLRRELLHWGETGAYCGWSHHRLIDAVPLPLRQQPQAAQLQDLSPRWRQLPDGRTAIEFFTCRTAAPIAIFRHIDLYSPTDYSANSLDRAITASP